MEKDVLKARLKDNLLSFIGEATAFRAAIIIPLVIVDGQWHVLFQVRALTLRKQPGDISFPGGKMDASDKTPQDAAIRETHEELGIQKSAIEVIGALSPYISTPSFVVYPFVAKININEMKINKAEVEKVFTVPLDWLISHEPKKHSISFRPELEQDFPFDKIFNGKNYTWRSRELVEYFYEYHTYTIWGLTARILKHFIEVAYQLPNKTTDY